MRKGVEKTGGEALYRRAVTVSERLAGAMFGFESRSEARAPARHAGKGMFAECILLRG